MNQLMAIAADASAHTTDRNSALRRLFLSLGFFAKLNAEMVAGGDEPFAKVADVPMGTVMEAVRPAIEAHRAEAARAEEARKAAEASAAANNLVATAQAAPKAPAPVAVKAPAPVVLIPAIATLGMADRIRGAVYALRAVSPAPAPIAARPSAPKPPAAERKPGAEEFLCTRCPRHHVAKIVDAHVAPLDDLREQLSTKVAPTREQLLALAGCRYTRHDGWYPLEQTIQVIERRMAERESEPTGDATLADAVGPEIAARLGLDRDRRYPEDRGTPRSRGNGQRSGSPRAEAGSRGVVGQGIGTMAKRTTREQWEARNPGKTWVDRHK